MIANFAAMEIRPGSMGRPLPGIEAAIVRRNADRAVEVDRRTRRAGRTGAASPAGPSMFRGYLHDEERYAKCFAAAGISPAIWPSAMRTATYWFVGRADDIIKTVRPHGRALRGGERADGASGGRRSRRDRQARSGDRRAGQGLRRAEAGRDPSEESAPGTDRLRAQEARLGRRAQRDRISAQPAARRAAARSCGGCSRRASWGCPKATPPRWRQQHDASDRTPTAGYRDARMHCICCGRCCASGASRRNAAELYSATKIRGFLHLYIGEEAVACRRDAGAHAGGRHRRHLSRAWPRAGPRHFRPAPIMAEMYGKQEGCSRGRGGSMHLFDATTTLLRRQRHRRRRPAARGRHGAGRQDARAQAA